MIRIILMLKVDPHNLALEQLFFFTHKFYSFKGSMIVFFTPLILFIICNYLLKKNLYHFLKKMSLVDYPSQRSNHHYLVPKGAGIILIPLLIISVIGIFFIRVFLINNGLSFLHQLLYYYYSFPSRRH